MFFFLNKSFEEALKYVAEKKKEAQKLMEDAQKKARAAGCSSGDGGNTHEYGIVEIKD